VTVDPFGDALRMMNADLDEHLGETVRVVGMRVGDISSFADPARPAFECIAEVHEHDPQSADIARLEGRVSYSEWEVEIRRANIPPMRRIQRGDHIYLIARGTLVRLLINRIDRYDRDVIAMTCGPVGDGNEP
jgi:hypothetical protein